MTVLLYYYSVIFLHIVYCLEIGFVSIIRHREGALMKLRTVLFWVIMQQVVVISY